MGLSFMHFLIKIRPMRNNFHTQIDLSHRMCNDNCHTYMNWGLPGPAVKAQKSAIQKTMYDIYNKIH